MSQKGFTLVELLATIVIIAIIMGIVLPSALKVSRTNQGKMLEEYKRVVEEYALVSPLKGQNEINIMDLDVPEKIKNDCTGYALLVNSKPVEYKAEITCNITATS